MMWTIRVWLGDEEASGPPFHVGPREVLQLDRQMFVGDEWVSSKAPARICFESGGARLFIPSKRMQVLVLRGASFRSFGGTHPGFLAYAEELWVQPPGEGDAVALLPMGRVRPTAGAQQWSEGARLVRLPMRVAKMPGGCSDAWEVPVPSVLLVGRGAVELARTDDRTTRGGRPVLSVERTLNHDELKRALLALERASGLSPSHLLPLGLAAKHTLGLRLPEGNSGENWCAVPIVCRDRPGLGIVVQRAGEAEVHDVSALCGVGTARPSAFESGKVRFEVGGKTLMNHLTVIALGQAPKINPKNARQEAMALAVAWRWHRDGAEFPAPACLEGSGSREVIDLGAAYAELQNALRAETPVAWCRGKQRFVTLLCGNDLAKRFGWDSPAAEAWRRAVGALLVEVGAAPSGLLGSR